MSEVTLLIPMLHGMSWESFVTIRNLRGPIGETLITPMVPLSEARNVLVRRFLRDTTGDFCMMLAGDMVYQDTALESLLQTAQEHPEAAAIIGIYYARAYNFKPMVFEKLGVPFIGHPNDKPFRVHSSGLDCALFRRDLFEKMSSSRGRWFRFTERLSEDIFFCDSMPTGMELWCDPRVKCGHLSKVVINERWSRNAKFAVDLLGLDDLPLQPVVDEEPGKKPPVTLVKDGE